MHRRCDIGGFDCDFDSLALDEYGPEQRSERGGGANLLRVREIDEGRCVDRERNRGVALRDRWSRGLHGSARSGTTGTGVVDLRTRVLACCHGPIVSRSCSHSDGSIQCSSARCFSMHLASRASIRDRRVVRCRSRANQASPSVRQPVPTQFHTPIVIECS